MSAEMREPTYWILTAMAAGRRHGYALIKDVAELSNGLVELKVTTLYSALERLEVEGFVALDGDEVVEGRQRRYFRLTALGAEALAAESERLAVNARRAADQLRAHGWNPGRPLKGMS